MSASQPIVSDAIASQPPKAVVQSHGHKDGVIPYDVVLEDDAPRRDPDRDSDAEKFPTPTDEELLTLRKVHGTIPWVAWSLCLVELVERATYYGASGIFSNFVQFSLPENGNGAGAPPRGTQQTAGALDKGLQFSSAFLLLFRFLAYAIPIFGAWLADAKIGRYPAIGIGVIICGIAHVIQVVGAIPSVLQAGNGTAPFIIGLLLLAIGSGIFKPSILPLILDQYRHQRQYTTVLKSGEKVIVDPELTIARITLLFYGFVNVGAFFPIATTYTEKYIGFWLAFLLPGALYFALPFLLLFTYRRTFKAKPSGSELSDFFRVLRVGIRRNKGKLWGEGFWTKATPSAMAADGLTSWQGKRISWNDQFVRDVRRTVSACGMFLYFPIWNFNNGGIGGLAASQGSTLRTDGTPNDILQNFSALTIIVMIPFLTYIVYPTLARYKINFGRCSRITFGFCLAMISSVVGAVLQWYIYKHSPCGKYATGCEEGTGVVDLSIWAQMPIVMLGAMSECFCQVTAYEIAYARAPKNLKSMVMAIFLFMNALSSALAQILIPVIRDPYLIWVWASPAIALFLQTVVFYWKYRWMNSDEFMTHEVDNVSMERLPDLVEPEKAMLKADPDRKSHLG